MFSSQIILISSHNNKENIVHKDMNKFFYEEENICKQIEIPYF